MHFVGPLQVKVHVLKEVAETVRLGGPLTNTFRLERLMKFTKTVCVVPAGPDGDRLIIPLYKTVLS